MPLAHLSLVEAAVEEVLEVEEVLVVVQVDLTLLTVVAVAQLQVRAVLLDNQVLVALD